jgi:hypothetical protein
VPRRLRTTLSPPIANVAADAVSSSPVSDDFSNLKEDLALEGATMRKLALVLAGALTLVVSGGAFAAAPLVNEHNRFTDTFQDELCGISGTSTISVVDNFKLYADGTFRDTGGFRQVFTATESGKSIIISSGGQVTGLDEPIQNPDGTVTFITTYKGLPEKLSIAGGPTLLRDAGVVTITTTLRPLGDDEFEFVSQTISGEHGPHPDLASDFELFCEVLVPALT